MGFKYHCKKIRIFFFDHDQKLFNSPHPPIPVKFWKNFFMAQILIRIYRKECSMKNNIIIWSTMFPSKTLSQDANARS